ncbi:MAG: AAA family ATPase [Candidatus Coatesbacteria bacterium]|nr:AAA family ATPase [Candidatus Coatesbacteria bacterium]
MNENLYFLKELSLFNFMLHKETRIGFEAPITVIIGANGTGKTQILDAMLLLLGYPTSRIRKGEMHTLVGSYSEKAIIKGSFSWKPQYDMGQCLGTTLPSSDLSGFMLELIISNKGETFYQLSTANRIFKPSRAQVRNLFSQISVQGDNRLSFTEEGTVNIFAGESPRTKLELLLKTTGLLETRKSILEAMEISQKCKYSNQPLKERLKLELERLTIYEDNLSYINKRKDLEDEIRILEIELEYTKFNQLVQLMNKTEEQIISKKEHISRINEQLKNLEIEEAKVKEKLANHKKEKTEHHVKLENVIQDLGRLKHLVNEKREKLKKNGEEILRIDAFLSKKDNDKTLEEINKLKQEIARKEVRKLELAERESISKIQYQIPINTCLTCIKKNNYDFFPSLEDSLTKQINYPWWDRYIWENYYLRSDISSGLYLHIKMLENIEKEFLKKEKSYINESLNTLCEKLENLEKTYRPTNKLIEERKECLAKHEIMKKELDEEQERLFETSRNQRDLETKIEMLDKFIDNLKDEIIRIGRDILDFRKNLDKESSIQDEIEKILLLQKENLRLMEKSLPQTEIVFSKFRDISLLEREISRKKGLLQGMKFASLNQEQYEKLKERVNILRDEIEGNEEHLSNIQNDLETRLNNWQKTLNQVVNQLKEHMQILLGGIFAGVELKLNDIFDIPKAGLELRFKRRLSRYFDLSNLSGGEKVLVIEALILSFHLLTRSPLHAIDEFTQKLDIEFKTLALAMVLNTLETIKTRHKDDFFPQFILLCPELLGIELDRLPQVSTYILGVSNE